MTPYVRQEGKGAIFLFRPVFELTKRTVRAVQVNTLDDAKRENFVFFCSEWLTVSNVWRPLVMLYSSLDSEG